MKLLISVALFLSFGTLSSARDHGGPGHDHDLKIKKKTPKRVQKLLPSVGLSVSPPRSIPPNKHYNSYNVLSYSSNPNSDDASYSIAGSIAGVPYPSSPPDDEVSYPSSPIRKGTCQFEPDSYGDSASCSKGAYRVSFRIKRDHLDMDYNKAIKIAYSPDVSLKKRVLAAAATMIFTRDRQKKIRGSSSYTCFREGLTISSCELQKSTHRIGSNAAIPTAIIYSDHSKSYRTVCSGGGGGIGLMRKLRCDAELKKELDEMRTDGFSCGASSSRALVPVPFGRSGTGQR